MTNLLWTFLLITVVPMLAVSGWIITRRRTLPAWHKAMPDHEMFLVG